jgi:hypothetical protein
MRRFILICFIIFLLVGIPSTHIMTEEVKRGGIVKVTTVDDNTVCLYFD